MVATSFKTILSICQYSQSSFNNSKLFGNMFDKLKIVKCDLDDVNLSSKLTNSKYVIHAANADVTGGFFKPQLSEKQKKQLEAKPKIMGDLVQACNEANIKRLVICSSF